MADVEVVSRRNRCNFEYDNVELSIFVEIIAKFHVEVRERRQHNIMPS